MPFRLVASDTFRMELTVTADTPWVRKKSESRSSLVALALVGRACPAPARKTRPFPLTGASWAKAANAADRPRPMSAILRMLRIAVVSSAIGRHDPPAGGSAQRAAARWTRGRGATRTWDARSLEPRTRRGKEFLLTDLLRRDAFDDPAF